MNDSFLTSKIDEYDPDICPNFENDSSKWPNRNIMIQPKCLLTRMIQTNWSKISRMI